MQVAAVLFVCIPWLALCQPATSRAAAEWLAHPEDECMFQPNGNTLPISGQKAVDSFLARLPKGQSFYKAMISGCVLHFSFAGRDIRFMSFYNISAPGADFSKATASHATFDGSNFYKAHFFGCKSGRRFFQQQR
jgi:uncharacterized protein YjbI with pentapeptide repeats